MIEHKTVPALEEMRSRVSDAFESGKDQVQDWEGEQPGSIKDLALKLYDKYHTENLPKLRPVAAEEGFAVKLGTVPVTGQDGDKAALNRVALGTQLVSVWKDSRVLGKMAGEAAVALIGGTAMDALPGVAKFSGGKKGVEMNSILIPPNPITKDNLNDVIDAGWISKEEACAGVAAGSVAACN